MAKLNIIPLLPVAALTATANSTGVDVSDLIGNGSIVLSAAAAPAGQTLNVKLQHADTLNGVYTDAGVEFTQVTAAARAFQRIDMSLDGFKKFVRVTSTIAGGSTAHAHHVTLVGNSAQ